MPQIWLTYEELGRFMNMTGVEARSHAMSKALDRRQCSDGQSRVKLPPTLVEDYLVAYMTELNTAAPTPPTAEMDRLADELVERLRQVISDDRAADNRRSG